MFHHRKTIRRGLVALATFLAARCFLKYRKAGGARTSTLQNGFEPSKGQAFLKKREKFSEFSDGETRLFQSKFNIIR